VVVVVGALVVVVGALVVVVGALVVLVGAVVVIGLIVVDGAVVVVEDVMGVALVADGVPSSFALPQPTIRTARASAALSRRSWVMDRPHAEAASARCPLSERYRR
jgi:hypothetical protein